MISASNFYSHNIYATEYRDDKVIATVNNFKFYESDIKHARKQLPPDVKNYSKEAVRRYILESLIDTHLVAVNAREAGFDKRPEMVNRLRRLEDQILYRSYIDEQISGILSEKLLRRHYQIYLDTNSATEEIRARHILLQTREQAKEVIRQLNEGKIFADLAKTFSTGPSGKKGGDLGYFTSERMVPSFSEAAFAIPVGSFTVEPVKTQFGWHVIKVEDKRVLKPKSFDKIKTKLREKIITDLINTVVSKLRKSAEIKIFDNKKNKSSDDPD